MSAEIRPAEATDTPALSQIVERAYEGYVPRIGRRPAPMDADYAALVRDGAVFVWDDGAVRAVLVLIAAEDHLLIENVAVDPSLHGRGIGRRLMAFAEDQARARGLGELRLYTNAKMTENLAFYPRLGYREYDRRGEAGFSRVYFSKRISCPD